MTTASKRKWRCRGCGNYLDLEETHHGSHVVYDQAGARECGPVDEVKQHFLRFACGAVSPPFAGSFRDWVKGEIKARKGFAVGHQRQDGRYRVIAYDLDGQSLSPRMPDGRRSPCLTCPCPKEAGRREVEAKRVDLRGIRRIVVTCYPEEVSA